MIFKEYYEVESSVGTLTIELYTPEAPERIIYFFGPSEDMNLPYDLMDEKRFACVSIMGMNWGRDLTPWPAPALSGRAGSEDFGGQADQFLKDLFVDIVPQAEEILEDIADELPPSFAGRRYVSGISLGGLFALYSMYRTDLFVGGAMISASLWYDGFLDFMKKYGIYKRVQKTVFLLGDKEKNAKDKRMAVVEDCTREAVSLLEAQGVQAQLELVPGGHFADGEERIEKAFGLLMS